MPTRVRAGAAPDPACSFSGEADVCWYFDLTAPAEAAASTIKTSNNNLNLILPYLTDMKRR
jgi:hypothetical protein